MDANVMILSTLLSDVDESLIQSILEAHSNDPILSLQYMQERGIIDKETCQSAQDALGPPSKTFTRSSMSISNHLNVLASEFPSIDPEMIKATLEALDGDYGATQAYFYQHQSAIDRAARNVRTSKGELSKAAPHIPSNSVDRAPPLPPRNASPSKPFASSKPSSSSPSRGPTQPVKSEVKEQEYEEARNELFSSKPKKTRPPASNSTVIPISPVKSPPPAYTSLPDGFNEGFGSPSPSTYKPVILSMPSKPLVLDNPFTETSPQKSMPTSIQSHPIEVPFDLPNPFNDPSPDSLAPSAPETPPELVNPEQRTFNPPEPTYHYQEERISNPPANVYGYHEDRNTTSTAFDTFDVNPFASNSPTILQKDNPTIPQKEEPPKQEPKWTPSPVSNLGAWEEPGW